jgi:uncharacterized integral membrane protein
MNLKLLFKAVLFVAACAFLVMLGMNNPKTIELYLPPIVKTLKWPAGYMYIGFFGVGFIVGALLMAGGTRGAGKSGKEK